MDDVPAGWVAKLLYIEIVTQQLEAELNQVPTRLCHHLSLIFNDFRHHRHHHHYCYGGIILGIIITITTRSYSLTHHHTPTRKGGQGGVGMHARSDSYRLPAQDTG